MRCHLALAPLLLALSSLTGCTSEPEDDAAGVSNGACMDFLLTVNDGPNAGQQWTGDLVMRIDEGTGQFDGALVPPEADDRDTYTIIDESAVICDAIGQINGRSVDWFLYCEDQRIFGTGMIDNVA